MASLKILLKRDLKNALNIRVTLVLIVLCLLQIFFDLAGGLPAKKLHLEVMFFPVLLLGFFASISITFDAISRDREGKIMDYILTTPIDKKIIVLSRIITIAIISIVFSMIYSLIGYVFSLVISSGFGFGTLLKAFFATEVLFLIYGMWGLLCSILFRKSKISFFTALAVAMLIRPQILDMIASWLISGVGVAKDIISKIFMITPESILYSIISSGVDERFNLNWGLSFMVLHLLVLTILAFALFARQEEASYDE